MKKVLTSVLYIIYDLIAAAISVVMSFYFLEEEIILGWLTPFSFIVFVWPFAVVFSLYLVNVYKILWRFSGINEIFRIIFGCIAAFLATVVAKKAIFSTDNVRISIFFLTYFFSVFFIIIHRYIAKYISNKKSSQTSNSNNFSESNNIMIIGAGSAAESVINEFSYKNNCRIRCVIDDNTAKHNQYICGVHIVGGRESIISSVEKYDINTIIFAIPSCDKNNKTQILNICQQTKCDLKIVPPIYELNDINQISSSIRNVEIEDLLGRDPIVINDLSSYSYVNDRVVLVTGGGGTIGSELCRQIAFHNPKQLIILDVYENNAYEIQNELKFKYPSLNLVTLIGSVRDTKRLDYIFKTYRPNIVYHAAAHKHVPLMEDSPNETIKNNVFGTYKTAQAADKYGVNKFVLISTDKAVNPTNIMGASKRICEMIVQSFNNRSNTEFVAVRFGNVLGSNGSVIPLFKKQISRGGPVTVTDPNIIRYFMTIPEAVSLVIQAGANAKGGEIFVLDMGQPVKILTLAENLIKLSGFTPYKDIQIKFIGLRPGEKLYEELLMSEEGLTATDNELIHIGRPIEIDEDLLFATIEEMRSVMYDENANIRNLVKKIVPTYQIPLDIDNSNNSKANKS